MRNYEKEDEYCESIHCDVSPIIDESRYNSFLNVKTPKHIIEERRNFLCKLKCRFVEYTTLPEVEKDDASDNLIIDDLSENINQNSNSLSIPFYLINSETFENFLNIEELSWIDAVQNIATRKLTQQFSKNKKRN